MAETQSAPSYGAGYPAGAIHNGRESLRRLAAHHAFESAGTPLAMCADYDEAVRCFEFIVSALAMAGATQELRVVFDGPPGINGGRFVEVEDASGHSVRAGEWHARPDGYHELRIVAPTTPTTQSEAVASARAEGYAAGAMDMRDTAANAINASAHRLFGEEGDALAVAILSDATLMVRDLPLTPGGRTDG